MLGCAGREIHVNMLRFGPLLGAALSLALPAAAHHSVSAWFDTSQTSELEGDVVAMHWQNPHVRFTLSVPGADGSTADWEIETLSLSGISRWGITEDLIAVGDHLKVAGNPSKRSSNNLFVRNILLPTGEEILLGGKARWSGETLRAGEVQSEQSGDATAPELGLFRTWVSAAGGTFLFPEEINPDFDFAVYPLTSAARATLEAFDYARDDPTKNCAQKGMPTIMEQPYPLEFVDNGAQILLHLEEYDTRRIIHVGDALDPATQPPSVLGYSVGHWEDDTLVVVTTRLGWGHFDTVGIPLTLDAVVVERFTPSTLGDRLDYSMTITDPAIFTEPVMLVSHWIYRPEVTIGPFRCTPEV
jgi:Family of unknown function (DUF6152)